MRSPRCARRAADATSRVPGGSRARGGRTPPPRRPRRAAPPVPRVRRACRGAAPGCRADANRERAARQAGSDLCLELERAVAEFGEPVAALGDEVQRQPVPARRHWRHHREPHLRSRCRRDAFPDRAEDPAPYDRISERVEPVVRDADVSVPFRLPCGGAGVLELGTCVHGRAGAQRREVVPEPARGQRAARHRLRRDDRWRRGASLEPCLSRSSCAPAGASPSTHAGLVHAPGGPLTARVPGPARAAHAARDLPRRPSCAPRSRCSRSPLASTRPSCSPTSCCRSRRWASTFEFVEGDRAGRSHEPIRDGAPTSSALRVSSRDEALAVRARGHPPRAPRARRTRCRSSASAGAPFTLASYADRGRPSRDFARDQDDDVRRARGWHALMEQLADVVAATCARRSRRARRRSSSSTRGSARSRRPTTTSSSRRTSRGSSTARGSRRARRSTSAPAPRRCSRRWREAGGDVIGVDWRIPLDEAWARVGDDRGMQGNLDPLVLLGAAGARRGRRADVLARAGGRPGHIFNLGHGVCPRPIPASCGGWSTWCTSARGGGGRVEDDRDGAAPARAARRRPPGGVRRAHSRLRSRCATGGPLGTFSREQAKEQLRTCASHARGSAVAAGAGSCSRGARRGDGVHRNEAPRRGVRGGRARRRRARLDAHTFRRGGTGIRPRRDRRRGTRPSSASGCKPSSRCTTPRTRRPGGSWRSSAAGARAGPGRSHRLAVPLVSPNAERSPSGISGRPAGVVDEVPLVLHAELLHDPRGRRVFRVVHRHDDSQPDPLERFVPDRMSRLRPILVPTPNE